MLAAAMVFSMAAPGYPAYAVNFGDPVKLKFDPAGPWRGICLWQMDRQEVL